MNRAKRGVFIKTVIKNGKVITPYEVLCGVEVVIAKGKITEIKATNDVDGTYDHVIDAQGKFLAPGFIDIHNHGNSGFDFMKSSYEAIENIASFHLKNGVTSFLATTITAPKEDLLKAVKSFKNYMIDTENKKDGLSQLLGVYLEGPYFAPNKKGAQPLKHLKKPQVKELTELLDVSGGMIKVVSLAPELDGATEVISFLKENGISPFAGHTDGSFEQTQAAISLGVIGATHLFNGMRGFTHREPGVAGAVLTDQRVMCELICDGIHVHPKAMELAYKLKGKNGIILVSDAMMAAGLPDGDYDLGGQKVIVKDKVARLEDGTLAGSTLTLSKAVANMVNMVNVPIHEAVGMATLNPAKVIGVADNKGSIETGKDADLVLFDENIKITDVIVGGKIRK
ncbi:N-acetylglucosamine-6-phosphate deacetylase [Proteinivorax hydrogeniformans]|uniref:N-acetylglucosamine-6-phosphate deacetylase n=1 Tax=Proteinivorax hydrogeniformans TaxID=1826727 RepID=A0AAU8HXD0_9FIRM